MSMTLVNAKIYVAQVIGGANSPHVIAAAGEAILKGYQDWQAARFWRFLLKDTSLGFKVTGVALANDSYVVSAPSIGAFDGVNVGVTVTAADGHIPADTTVTAYTRDENGIITSITLSAYPSDDSTSTTLTFSGDIPVVVGTRSYNVPTDFGSPFGARLISNTKRPLTYRDIRQWDRTIYDQTVQGIPLEYTLYNPYSELTQNYGVKQIMFDRIPAAADTLQLRYYRVFNTTGTYIDMPDDVLYKFLDYCRSLLLHTKRAQDDPVGYQASVMDSFQQAQEGDEEPTDDNDVDMCMKSQYEMGDWNRPLWGNGDFDPYR